jgi:hypothetical protein
VCDICRVCVCWINGYVCDICWVCVCWFLIFFLSVYLNKYFGSMLSKSWSNSLNRTSWRFSHACASGIVLRIAGEEDRRSESQNCGISVRLDPRRGEELRIWPGSGFTTRVGFHDPVRKLETLICQNMKCSALGFLNK